MDIVLLIVYVSVALMMSFLCSIAEAVMLSVSSAYIHLLEQEEKPSGALLRDLKEDFNKPLAAILTLNTISHTMGAAGAGAQAAVVFGSAFVGLFSAVLTFLILVFSEIIPKTLGAHYWRQLAPATAYGLRFLIWLLYPFVKMSEKLAGGLTGGSVLVGFSRGEFSAMAEISAQEGELEEKESKILKNLLLLRELRAKDVMTPQTVVFSLPKTTRVEEFFHKYDGIRFSRIPVYDGDRDQVIGFILRSDLLLAQARGNIDKILGDYLREIPAVLDSTSLLRTFDEFIPRRVHIMLVVDEYGSMKGILTLEDVLETLLGLEIMDEGDKNVDMQELARRLGKRRASVT
ncbi:MAG: HlyC/CorC family transporter [Nitrococcus mobilis]|nr:HlyC/CorC family transporter [Nitrococcus mobilis]